MTGTEGHASLGRRSRGGAVRRAASIACAALLGIGVLPGAPALGQDAATDSPFVPPPAPVIASAPPDWPAPSDLDVAAYVLVDAATGQVLAAQDADLARPVASTVKVLTVLSAWARTELGEEVTAGAEVEGVPGSGVGLAPGDTWTVRELLDALIARSGNEAAEMLAVHVAGDTPAFLSMMRADAVAMGLAEPPLVSVSGLDDDNRFSARDLATIARVALDESELRPILGARQVTLPGEGTVETRNELLLSYPDATGVKTGFTSLAGNSLIGSAQRDGRELVAVVLGAGEDPARFDAAAELLDLGFEAFAATTLGAETGYAVAGGEVVVRVDALEVLAPTQATAQLRLPLAARAPDQAPSVSVEVDGTPLGTADAEVDRAGVGAPVESDAAIGRAAVDGVWAALRAATAQDGLG